MQWMWVIRFYCWIRQEFKLIKWEGASLPWPTPPSGSTTTSLLQDLHFLMFEDLLQPHLARALIGEVVSRTSFSPPFSYHLSYPALDFLIVILSYWWLFWFLFPFNCPRDSEPHHSLPFTTFFFGGKWKGLKLWGEGKRHIN